MSPDCERYVYVLQCTGYMGGVHAGVQDMRYGQYMKWRAGQRWPAANAEVGRVAVPVRHGVGRVAIPVRHGGEGVWGAGWGFVGGMASHISQHDRPQSRPGLSA